MTFISNKYFALIILIVIISAFFRFQHLSSRISLAEDQSRDIAIAKEAIIRHQIPLSGTFLSAGPFVFGPYHYWFIMASYLILPFTLLAPYIMTCVVGLLTVLALIYWGKIVAGKRFSLILGMLAATSPQLISRSLLLMQHTFVLISSILLLIAFTLLWQKKKIIYSFFMGIFLGIAIWFHYQALNLLIFLLLILVIPQYPFKKKVFSLISMILGLIVSSLPMIIWDSHQDWANFRNVLDYFLIAQYRSYVPNNWHMYLLDFFPKFWSSIAGGYSPISWILLLLNVIVVSFLILKHKISGLVFSLGMTFFILVFTLRYYRGERYDVYLHYMTPFVVFFSAWVIEELLVHNKVTIFKKKFVLSYFAIMLFFMVLFANVSFSQKSVYYSSQYTENKRFIDKLQREYPGRKFSVYDANNLHKSESYALSIFLKQRNMLDLFGTPLVVCNDQCYDGVIVGNVFEYNIAITNLAKSKYGYCGVCKNVNQDIIYNNTMGWLNEYNLRSTFSLNKYILEKLAKLI